jgi:hypothetical protein
MSVNLTTALQNISGRNPNFVELDASGEPIASRQTGIVLSDLTPVALSGKTNVTWQANSFGQISACVAAAAAPSGAANLVEATPNGSSGAASLRALVPADLPVGSASQLGALQVDGTTITAASGVISAVAPPSGMTLIQKQTVSGGNTVTFSAIPQTFTHLKIVLYAQSNGNDPSEVFGISYNGVEGGTNYSSSWLLNSGNAAQAATNPNDGRGWLYNTWDGNLVTLDATIYNYAATSVKNLSFVGSFPEGVRTGVVMDSVTTAISSLRLFSVSGTPFTATFSLYGLS